MPPNFQRFLPIVLIAAVALFLLPTLLKKHHSGPSTSAKASQTIDAMHSIDAAGRAYRTAHSRVTPHLADLLTANSRQEVCEVGREATVRGPIGALGCVDRVHRVDRLGRLRTGAR